MYITKYAKGTVPIGDFIRFDKGAEAYYEVVGGNPSKTMNLLQSHVSQYGAKTAMRKLILVDYKNNIALPMIHVTLIEPARSKQARGVKPKQKTPPV